MNWILRVGLLFGLFLFLPLRGHTLAAITSSTIEPSISDLADRLSASLRKAGMKSVVVLDLRGPQRESHPVGRWLADHLSAALKMSSSELDVVDRSEVIGRGESNEDSPNASAPGKKQIVLARSVGANAVITGSYAKTSRGLGITLLTTNLSPSKEILPSIRGAVPISDEISGLSADPIPSFNGDILPAGTGGITDPTCIRCPQPQYTDRARSAKYQGTVVLDVIVTAEGTVDKVVVMKGPGLGLEENTIETVKKWRLKPGEDLDNRPVTTRVKIEVTYHLY
jgi:TonB family protein